MTKPRSFYYYYTDPTDDSVLIRIKGKRQPGATTIPCGGTWVIREFHEKQWLMPSYPEITWSRLSKMRFVKKELTDVQ